MIGSGLREQRDRMKAAAKLRGQYRDEWRKRAEAAEAELSRLRDERDAAIDAVGLPRTASLDDLIRHHRGNAATAAGFDQIAAEARCAQLEAEALAFDNVRAAYDGLIEERDAENTEKAEWYSKALAAQQDKEAAEARCARLQQEADRQLALHLCYMSALSRKRFWRAVDEALAGPDTPAEEEA